MVRSAGGSETKVACHAVDGPPGLNIAAIPGPPLPRMVPTLVMTSVEPEEWDRKAEAGYAISLTLRLGFCSELNNST